jgi:hypothetical protein
VGVIVKTKLLWLGIGLGLCIILVLFLIYGPYLGQMKIISTAWVALDPAFRPSDAFEFGEFRLGQPARGFVIDEWMRAARYGTTELPEFVTFCERDVTGDLILLVGHDGSSDKSKVFVRKEDGLIKVYEGGCISVGSMSPDGRRIALVSGEDVVVGDLEKGTFAGCGLLSVWPIVPRWYSDHEVLVSAGNRIVLYDVHTKVGQTVIVGESPILWRNGIVFQRFTRKGLGNCSVYFLPELGGQEELLFENPYISGPLCLSPDGRFLCCQARYTFTTRDWVHVLVPGNSLYVRDMETGLFTFYTDRDYYGWYWTWDGSVDQQTQ